MKTKTQGKISLVPIIALAALFCFFLFASGQHFLHKGVFAVNDSGEVTTGIWKGTVIAHEYGGLEADVNAYDGIVKITGGATSAVTIGIGDGNLLDVDDADAAQNDYIRLTASGAEGREYSEVLSDIGAQASDASLTSIAGLTYVSGSFIALTSADTYTVRTYAETLSDIGAQASDAELTALAGLTSPADKLPYFTGSGTADVTTLSAYMRGLLDDDAEGTLHASINLEIGTDVLAQQTIGIADNNLLEVDDAGPPAATQYARFTANGIEGRTEAEFKGDFNLEADTDFNAYDVDLATLAGPTAWRVFYSNGTSVMTELALGASGTYLKSNGAAAAPTFSAVTGNYVDDTEVLFGTDSDASIQYDEDGDNTWQFDLPAAGMSFRTAETDLDNAGLLKVVKVVKAHDSDLFDEVGLTDNATIWSQPANTVLLSAKYVLDTQFAASGLSDFDVTTGLAGDNDGQLAPATHNLFSDAAGTEYTSRGAYWSASIAAGYHADAIVAWTGYATAVGANLSTTSAGQITFYFLYLDFAGT